MKNLNHGSSKFYDKGPQALLCAASQAARGKITVHSMNNCLSYREIFIIYAHFTDVTGGHLIQAGRP
jgi:hypothetical protein